MNQRILVVLVLGGLLLFFALPPVVRAQAQPMNSASDTTGAIPCRKCGTANPREAQFCKACGAILAPRGSRKQPLLSCGLSAILPGTGQFYNGEYKKGGVQMALWAGGMGVTLYYGLPIIILVPLVGGEIKEKDLAMVGAGLVVMYGAWGWSVVDAPFSARRINRRRGYSSLGPPGVGLVFLPDPRDPGKARPGLGIRAGF